MGPRSRERGNRKPLLAPHAIRMLQWGRAHVSAETLLERFIAAVGQTLQWGRAHVSAETPPKRPSGPPRRLGFNGAALT